MKAQLKKAIETFAKNENISFLSACSVLQGAAAQTGNESVIEAIYEIKKASPEFKALMNA